MILRLAPKPLPRVWSALPGARGILLEKDIGVGHGRLKAKLLVFDSTKNLRNFWKVLGKGDLGRCCRGAVNGLYMEVQAFSKETESKSRLEADVRYFCVIGLVKGYLSMEIVSHEAIHAGFSFAKRKSRAPWDVLAGDFDEEAICYPSGRIASAISRELWAGGFYE